MSKIRVDSKCALYDGMSLTFKAPCNSDAVDGINVYYNGTANTFTFRDAHGANLASKSNLFTTGAYVKVVLDTTNKYAYLQNADTNNYLETAISNVSTTAAGKAITATYTASVGTSWTANSSGGYYQTVSVSGILATDNPIADVVLGATLSTNELYLAAWSNIVRITTAANSITLYAKAATTTAITVQLKVVR